jgi:hypothetical protein
MIRKGVMLQRFVRKMLRKMHLSLCFTVPNLCVKLSFRRTRRGYGAEPSLTPARSPRYIDRDNQLSDAAKADVRAALPGVKYKYV